MNAQILIRAKVRQLGITLIVFTCFMTGHNRVMEASKPLSAGSEETGTSEKLPSGVTRSDWSSILRAHQEWKHEVRANGKGWKVHNPGTNLTADFDGRGVRVQAAGADWSWGLDLASYGIGDSVVQVGEKVPKVRTAGRRLAYGWDGQGKRIIAI